MKEQDYSFISTPYPIDRKLYKYYSNAEYAVDCIKKRRIHLDDPKTFNDPFDATFSCPRYTSFDYNEDVGKTIENLIEYVISIPKGKQTVHTPQILKHLLNYQANLNSAMVIQPKNKTISDILVATKEKSFSDEEFYDTINDGFIETKRVMHLNCKISCFSEVWDSILMWSYYANCHKGVCIEFDLSRLDYTDTLNRNIIDNISRVHYTPVRADLLSSNNDNTTFNFLTTKADVWSHEHEWRLICESNNDFLPFDCISKVIIGANFDVNAPKYQELFKAVNTYEDLTIHKCMLSSEKYQIELKSIYDSSMYAYFIAHGKKGNDKVEVNIA